MSHPPSRLARRPGFFGRVLLFTFAHFSHHVLTAILVPLLPFIRREFDLSYTQSGLLVSSFSLAYGLGQLPAGWLADRIGARLLITVGICGVALMGTLAGLSHTFPMLAVCLALLGLAGGGYHPSASPLISAGVAERDRGKALGLHILGGSFSHFVAPLLVGALAVTAGWRGAYLWTALPVMLFGLLFFFYMGARPGGGQPSAAGSAPVAATEPSGGAWRLAVFLVMASAMSAFLASAVAFLPLLMVDTFGTSEEAAALFLSLVYAGGLWGGPLSGLLADRLGALRVLAAVGLVSGPLIALLGWVPYGPGYTVLLLALGTFLFMRMPPGESWIVTHTPARLQSTVLGVYFFAGIEGDALFTPLIGALVDRIGFRSSLTVTGAALTAIVLACSALLWRSRPRG